NFDENTSGLKNQACASCPMPYAGFSGPIPSVNLTIVAFPGSFHFRAGKRTAQRYTYSPWFPVLQFNETQALFFGGNFWDSRATGYLLQNPTPSRRSTRPSTLKRWVHPTPRASCSGFGHQSPDHHQVDDQQRWGVGRALRHRALRHRSAGPGPDGEKSHQAEPGSSIHDVPRAHRGPQATDDLLLQGCLGGEQWQERWGEKHRQQAPHPAPASESRSRRRASGRPFSSAGPPGPAKVLPGATLRVALGMQDPGARILRRVELKDHPLRIGNAGIRRRVELPNVLVRQSKVHGTDVVDELLRLPGRNDHAADRRPTEQP